MTVGASLGRLAERVVQWKSAGSGMEGRMRLAVAKAATRGRAAGVSMCRDGDADDPLTRDKVQFFR